MNLPLLFAHRGCSGAAPENTFAAFNLAVENGIPGIELDVHLARSGEAVVIHDGNLQRVAGIDIDVGMVDWSELSSVDVGSWYDRKYESEHIPLLEEVFDSLGQKVFFDVELKSESRNDERLAAAVAELVTRYKMQERCMISSFNPFSIREFRRLKTSVPTSVIYANNCHVPLLLRRGGGCIFAGCDIVKPHWKQARGLALAYHQKIRRRKVSTWTVNDEAAARALFEAGVDAVISDVPEKLLHLCP